MTPRNLYWSGGTAVSFTRPARRNRHMRISEMSVGRDPSGAGRLVDGEGAATLAKLEALVARGLPNDPTSIEEDVVAWLESLDSEWRAYAAEHF